MKASSTPAQSAPLSPARSAGFAEAGVRTPASLTRPSTHDPRRRCAGRFGARRSVIATALTPRPLLSAIGAATTAMRATPATGYKQSQIADCRIGEMQERGARDGSECWSRSQAVAPGQTTGSVAERNSRAVPSERSRAPRAPISSSTPSTRFASARLISARSATALASCVWVNGTGTPSTRSPTSAPASSRRSTPTAPLRSTSQASSGGRADHQSRLTRVSG